MDPILIASVVAAATASASIAGLMQNVHKRLLKKEKSTEEPLITRKLSSLEDEFEMNNLNALFVCHECEQFTRKHIMDLEGLKSELETLKPVGRKCPNCGSERVRQTMESYSWQKRHRHCFELTVEEFKEHLSLVERIKKELKDIKDMKAFEDYERKHLANRHDEIPPIPPPTADIKLRFSFSDEQNQIVIHSPGSNNLYEAMDTIKQYNFPARVILNGEPFLKKYDKRGLVFLYVSERNGRYYPYKSEKEFPEVNRYGLTPEEEAAKSMKKLKASPEGREYLEIGGTSMKEAAEALHEFSKGLYTFDDLSEDFKEREFGKFKKERIL